MLVTTEQWVNSSIGRYGHTARWLALIGFASAGPLAVMASKALWVAGVLIGLARLVSWIGIERGKVQTTLRRDILRSPALWLLALLALTSAAWALDPARSLERGLRLFLEFGVGALMIGLATEASQSCAKHLLIAAAAGLIAGSAIGTADILLSGQIMFWAHGGPPTAFAYGRSAAFIALATVPLAILLWLNGMRLIAVVSAAAGITFVLTTFNETAQFVFITAILGSLVALWRWSRPLPVLAFAIILVAMPVVIPHPMNSQIGCWLLSQKMSLVHRLGIWNYADSLMAERQIFGWGIEASRDVPGGTDRFAMPSCEGASTQQNLGAGLADRMPLHPHDFAMNLWLELGAVGAFLGLCVFLFWAWRMARLSGARACAFGAMAGGALLPAAVSFGMWQGWWITSLFLVAALCCLAPKPASIMDDQM